MVIDKAFALKAQAEAKIDNLLREFAAGKLNREQFNVLYQRFSGQLDLAAQIISTGDMGLVNSSESQQQSTIALRQAHMGKALGLRIYQTKTGATIETLGNFDVSAFDISPVLTAFSHFKANGKKAEPRVEEMRDKRWLLFAAGDYTTVVTLFHNEPSPMQMEEIKRLHHHFEVANQNLLETERLDSKELAYPFMVFVQQKLRR